jgi:flavin reductase (DIM6/NTAB) family NADH-FMN oxidoreductase RutF
MDRPNIVTLAWAGVVCSDPPMVSIAVRPGRYSHGLIRASQDFVVNIPTAALLDQVEYCGTVSGRSGDKWEACGFTPVAASVVSAPMIAECPVNMECQVQQMLSLGVHDLFVARIAAVWADEAVLDGRGEIDISLVDPLAYVLHRYYRLGLRVEPTSR